MYFLIVSPNDKSFELLQIDLLDISNLSGSNNNVKYLLICIDVHSRFTYVVPMKNKFADTINEAIEPILKSTKCKYIESDNGTEFKNNHFKDLLKKYNVDIIYVDVGNNHALGTVDRVCGTIRSLINKYLTANETTRYIDALHDLVYNYNHSFHKGIEGIPASYDENKIKLINMNKQQEARKEEIKFEINDNVRYVINRVGFSKGTLPKWSSKVHKIIEVSPHSYMLDNNKWYKYYELLSAETVQSLNVINTRSKTNIPTREQLKKATTIKRRLNKEHIDKNIINEKRERKQTNRFHF